MIHTYLIEDDDAHDLALDDDDAALVVDADAARVLQDVGAELAHELPVLVVDLHLVGERKHLACGRLSLGQGEYSI